MKHRYLITGATGFVGSWVTKALIEKGNHVSVIVRDKKLNWRIDEIANHLHVYETDLQSNELVRIVDNIKPTIIIHLAAYGALPGQTTSPVDLFDTNVNGLINLINAAKRHNVHRFINTGSSSEYGVKDKPIYETDILLPINDYGVSKAAATLYAHKMAVTEGLRIVTLRLFSPFGFFDDKNRLVSYVIEKALRHEEISLNSKTHVRDFVYIEDVVEAYIKAIEKEIDPGEVINIGSGEQHSVYDIVNNVIAITDSKSSISWGTMPKQSRQVEPKIWKADIKKANKLLDWQPKYSLEQGLEKTIELYKSL